jgi:hypothetical protein
VQKLLAKFEVFFFWNNYIRLGILDRQNQVIRVCKGFEILNFVKSVDCPWLQGTASSLSLYIYIYVYKLGEVLRICLPKHNIRNVS